MKVAIVTSSNAAAMSMDDPILVNALSRLGHQADRICWDDTQVQWSDYDCALIRSTWDYFERIDEFRTWLREVRRLVRLINDAAVLEWNLDKHYLLELAEKGLPIVPTQIHDLQTLSAAVEALWDQGSDAIVKPVVSGGSWGLHHLRPGDAIAVQPQRSPWLVQPFVPSIATKGELSVIMLGGVVSHGIRKRPLTGDIRVQKEFGGHNQIENPSEQACALAKEFLAACPGSPTYARADFVQRAGTLELMEIELIEPELFFALVPSAADRLAALLSSYNVQRSLG